MTPSEPLATLIGDLVGSKRTADRRDLQNALTTVLRRMNRLLKPRQRLQPTVGDEFQGGFSSVSSAVRASLLLRLELLKDPDVDSRYGLGFGAVTVFAESRSPRSQDGPGWWSARTAIDRAKKLSNSPRTSFARTAFECWREVDAPPTDAVALEAFLMCRDVLIDQMNPRGRRLLLGLLMGQQQGKLAADEGITQSAVSQSLANSGAFAIEASQHLLEEGTS